MNKMFAPHYTVFIHSIHFDTDRSMSDKVRVQSGKPQRHHIYLDSTRYWLDCCSQISTARPLPAAARRRVVCPLESSLSRD